MKKIKKFDPHIVMLTLERERVVPALKGSWEMKILNGVGSPFTGSFEFYTLVNIWYGWNDVNVWENKLYDVLPFN